MLRWVYSQPKSKRGVRKAQGIGGIKMVLLTFLVTADLDEIPEGKSDEFYALAMQEHIGKTALDELDYKVNVL
jgi:hypothetical protein